MTLIIDDELLQKCGGGSSEYWFSYADYTIKNISELDDLDSLMISVRQLITFRLVLYLSSL